MEKTENAPENDRTARLCEQVFTFLKTEGIDTPEGVCSETMNATLRILGIMAEFLQVDGKALTCGLLQNTIDQIEGRTPAPIDLDKLKGEGKISFFVKDKKTINN